MFSARSLSRWLSGRWALGFLCLAVVTTWCCAEQDAQSEARGAELSVENKRMRFFDDDTGVSLTDSFTLTNSGDASLRILEMSLDAPDGVFEVSLPQLPMTLGPGQTHTTEVTFTPIDCWSNEGELYIRTDTTDPVTVFFRPDDAASDVYVEPDPLDFGRLPVGESKTLTVTIVNPGGCVFSVEVAALVGSTDIRFADVVHTEDLVQEHPGTPLDMQTDKRLEVDIRFSPTEVGLGFATLQMITDHPRGQVISAMITANGVAGE